VKTFSFQSKDSLKIHAVKWLVDEAKLNICLVHGLGEHSGRYGHVAQFFNSKGANVYALDLRGHGRSEGARGCGPDLEAFMDDIDGLIAEMKKDNSRSAIPWIFYAHSMGGNLTLNYVLRRQTDCSAIVTTGPWITLESDPSGGLVLAASIINKFGGFTKSSDIDPTYVSTDAGEVAKYINDPLNHDKISSKAGMALYHAGQYLHNYKDGMPIPTLIMHAKQDKLTLASGSQQFAKNNPKGLTLELWEDVYHEMHNDVKRQELFDYTWSWLEDQKIM